MSHAIINDRTVYYVAFGCRGSFVGIEHYEVHLDGGYLAGKVFPRRKIGESKAKVWYARVGQYDEALGPFRNRKKATEALLNEYDKRGPRE